MSMKQVQAFQTDDGKLFEVESQAIAHEFAQKYNAQLIDFFSGGHCSYRADTAQGSMIRKSIIEWEAFKQVQEGKAA